MDDYSSILQQPLFCQGSFFTAPFFGIAILTEQNAGFALFLGIGKCFFIHLTTGTPRLSLHPDHLLRTFP